MNHAFEIAGVGLSSQQRALDVIANNIANMNTLGFKRSDVRFVELIASATDPLNPAARLGGGVSLAGVLARPSIMIADQGEIERTGDPLHIALQGQGFIEVMGARGESLLWRGGGLSIGADGLLTTAEGMPLQALITVPAEADALEIDANGVVRARIGEEFIELGQINLVQVEDPASLERLDQGFYRTGEATRTRVAGPGEDGAAEIVQGGLERSNVEIADEMVRLMLVQRAYAANAQIVQAADQLMAIANSLRR